MKAIMARRTIYALSALFGVFMCLALFFYSNALPWIQIKSLLPIILLLTAIMAGLWVRECNKAEIAHLIVENHLLLIPTAFHQGTTDERIISNLGMDIYVSYFGILLGSKIIKFNQDKIVLKRMEIRSDALSFTYGNNIKEESIQVLWPCPSKEEADRIASRFNYETGVVPTIRIDRKLV